MIRAALISLTLAAPASAQEDPAFIAKRAAGQLEAAQNALFLAEQGNDRVKALTQTIRAYEHGLTALREIRAFILHRELEPAVTV